MLVGDALGVPYEFHDPEDIPPPEDIAFEPPASFPRAHGRTPPGTWSDDGAQALCLLASLLDCGRLDPEDLGRRFLR
jgi:ADP-ribosylglycohydrolase